MESVWAKARLAQCSQWLYHLQIGESLMSNDVVRNDLNIPPIFTHAIAFWDEHHKKITLGNSTLLERRVYCDAD